MLLSSIVGVLPICRALEWPTAWKIV